jgi:hypothetical protein
MSMLKTDKKTRYFDDFMEVAIQIFNNVNRVMNYCKH